MTIWNPIFPVWILLKKLPFNDIVEWTLFPEAKGTRTLSIQGQT
jgi:hypothetical protein